MADIFGTKLDGSYFTVSAAVSINPDPSAVFAPCINESTNPIISPML